MADGQAQAAAAVTRGGTCAIGLFEATEQALALFLADARPGVADIEADAVAVFIGEHAQAHRTFAGELDGVADQVEQDLPQPHHVAMDTRARRCGVFQIELQTATLRQWLHQTAHIIQQLLQIERLHLQFQATRFDTRQIQRVVDQPQQMFTGAADCLRVTALALVEI
ncbi:hypothetical protein D3C71_1067880 [compost metagenome]